MNYSNTVTDSNRSENKMESYRMCLLVFQLLSGKSVHFWESRRCFENQGFWLHPSTTNYWRSKHLHELCSCNSPPGGSETSHQISIFELYVPIFHTELTLQLMKTYMHFKHVWYQDPPELQRFVTLSQWHHVIAGYLLVKLMFWEQKARLNVR